MWSDVVDLRDFYETRLGPQRAERMNPLASLHRAGVRLAFGTDAPVTPVAGSFR